MPKPTKRYSMTKVNLALLVLLGSLGTLGYAVWNTTPSSINDSKTGPAIEDRRAGGGPTKEEAEALRSEFSELLNLTDEQQKEIDSIRDDVMNDPNRMPFEIMAEAYKILTPEQREVADANRGQMMGRGAQMMQKHLEEAKEVLSPEEFERFTEKANERRSKMQERMSNVRSEFGGGSEREIQ